MRIWLLLLTVYWMSGCSFFAKNPEEPKKLTTFVTPVVVKIRWQQQVGDGLGDLYRLVTPAINMDSDTVFANDIYGKVYAYDRDTGAEKWMTSLNLDLASGVGTGSNLVLVGSLAGDVVALDKTTGERRWSTNVTGEILATPQTNDNIVVVQTRASKLYGLEASTGKLLWDYQTGSPAFTLQGTAVPLLLGNNLITGFANGKIAAFSANDGVLFWESRVAYPAATTRGVASIDQIVDVDGSPVVSNGKVYTVGYNGHLTSFDPNGRQLWAQDVSSHQSPLVINSRVFIASADSTLQAYDADTGQLLWKNDLLLYRQLSAPQNVAGFVTVADYQGYIHVFDSELGTIVGRARLGQEGIRSPMVSDGTYLYALTDGGKLLSLSLHLHDTRT